MKKSEEILKLYPDVDGIIAGNDMVAVSVYKTLSKKGYRVPEDIQLIVTITLSKRTGDTGADDGGPADLPDGRDFG